MAVRTEALLRWRRMPTVTGEARLTKRRLLFPAGCLLLLSAFWITYLLKFGFSKGLDSTLPEFGRYWYTLLAVDLLVLLPALCVIIGRWALTRCKTCAADIAATGEVSAAHELEHHWTFLGLLLAGSLASVAMLAVGGGGDAAWHQSVLRDTSITPIHVISFYGFSPMYVVLWVGGYVYARTRLPQVWGGHRGVPYAYLIFAGGQLGLLVMFTMNEFGHAQWIFEELFTHPFHQLLVPFQATQLAVFPIALISLARVFTLLTSEDRGAGHVGGAGDTFSAAAD